MASSTSKPQFSSCQKLLLISLLSLTFVFLVFSFKPKPHYTIDVLQKLQTRTPTITWSDFLEANIGKGKEKIKIGLVNADESVRNAYKNIDGGLLETVTIDFQTVSKDLKWNNLFPEWIDEDEKWHKPKCPEIPIPTVDKYLDLDVVVARVPCGGGGGGGSKQKKEKGVRDVFRLQVNLVVAHLVVANGWVKPEVDRTVYVVFMGSCGAMQEIFRCDDLVTHVGDYWVYKPDLKKLKQKVLLPVGSCQIAPPYAEAGKEVWRRYMSQKLNHPTYLEERVAYATVLHSSEKYVCGAITLAQSIRLTGSTKDLVLLHDSSISDSSLYGLRAAGWKTKLIKPIRSPFARKGSYNEWNYSKLRVWQLTEYDKLIFVDADIVILENIDKFFVYPQLSAAGNDGVLFNSGIMVLEPSMCTFDRLMLKTSKIYSYNGGDQGFLNELFTWWHRLPSKLNYLKVFLSSGNEEHRIKKNIYSIHFLGLKPWFCYKDYDCNWDQKDHQIFASDSASRRWWKVYDSMPKKLQSHCKLTKVMDAKIRKWRRVAKNLNLPDGHWKIKIKDPRQYHL